jgi:hypothetical protein
MIIRMDKGTRPIYVLYTNFKKPTLNITILRLKERVKIHYTKSNQKKTRVAKLISIKTDFRRYIRIYIGRAVI